MKPTALFIALIAFATGCSASVQTADSPSTRTASAKSTPVETEAPVVLPYNDMAPPGTMDFEWEPTAPPPPKKIRPREMDAKPHFVSDKKRRGRLFVAPTINQR